MRQFQPDATPTEAYLMISGIFVFKMVALAAAVFATGVIGQEVEQKTVVYLLTRPVPRPVLLVMRALAAATVVLLLGLGAAAMASLGAFGGIGESFGRDVPALAVGAAVYTGLFVLISLLVNRAMIFCLLFAFGWETAVPNMPEGMSRLSINAYLTSIANHPSVAGPKDVLDALAGALSRGDIPSRESWISMVVFGVALWVLAALWVQNFEFVPREDAE
jgi:ABC-2 type transport system permease protein